MLANMAFACAFLGKRREVRAAVEHALSLPDSHATPRLRIWQAWLLALDGKGEAALSRAAELHATPLSEYVPSFYFQLRDLAGAVLLGRGVLSPELDERTRLQRIAGLLRNVPGSMWKMPEPLPWGPLYWPSALRIARAGGRRRWLCSAVAADEPDPRPRVHLHPQTSQHGPASVELLHGTQPNEGHKDLLSLTRDSTLT
jgi:hypothetical protein